MIHYLKKIFYLARVMTIRRMLDVRERVLDIFFPPRCAVCGEVIPVGEPQPCLDCKSCLPYVKPPYCMKCGKEVEREEDEYCQDCIEKERHYRRGFPVFRYEPPITESLLSFKYEGKKEYATFYADEIYKRYGRRIGALGIDALIPVPIYKGKYYSRGYNQAELIAIKLEKRMNIPVRNDIIARVRDTIAQKDIQGQERENNLKKAFACTGDVSGINRVLLVDDIYTTGATIEACTNACISSGIKEIYYTSVAIGKGN